MSGHTPGPWEFRASEDGIFGAEGAHVTTFGDTYPHDCMPKTEDMALILAAPDLLEALEGLLYWAPDIPAAENARAAIARAKGESQ